MPCPQDQTRVDRFGRAYKGSQRQIQTYVNLRPIELSQRIVEFLTPSPPRDACLDWVSPLATKGYAEYRDSEFLEVLQLEKHIDALSKFWPERGPCWDALGVVDVESGPKGYILIEAKSHISELESQCQAESRESLVKICNAFAETKSWLGVPASVEWKRPYYQSANRLAFLCFLRMRGVAAWLVNLYFINDPYKPTTLKEWRVGVRRVKHELGLDGIVVPYSVELFLKAEDSY